MENIKDYQQYLRGYDYTGKIPVIIDFYATWCGPCQGMAPLLKRLAQDYEGRVKVLKVDVDKKTDLKTLSGLKSIDVSALLGDASSAQEEELPEGEEYEEGEE